MLVQEFLESKRFSRVTILISLIRKPLVNLTLIGFNEIDIIFYGFQGYNTIIGPSTWKGKQTLEAYQHKIQELILLQASKNM